MSLGYAVVHRDSLSLSPLYVDGTDTGVGDDGPVSMKVDDGGVVLSTIAYDIDETSSPFVEGSQVTNDIRTMVEQTLRVQVRAVDQSDLAIGIGTLLAAATQPQFVTDLVLGAGPTATFSWSCRRKTQAMAFDRSMVFANICVVTVVFDRFPTALSGPF